MKQYRYSLISFAVLTACYSQYAVADLESQCLLGVPHFNGEVIQGDQTQLPVYIESDRAEINYPTNATYSGQVNVKQGNRSLIAEEVSVEQPNEQTQIASLVGEFDYRDNLINATGRDAKVNLKNNEAQLAHTNYQFVGRQGRGSAEQVELSDQTRRMKNATFTACLPNDNAWKIEASEMVQYVKDEYAELWHARFKVLDVPVFYSPYLQFPIGDRRRSGLLIPNIGHSSRDGYGYSQPIYWNIAPNVDATFTPSYYSHRGWKINPELRYLTALGEGKIAGEYLNQDRLPTWTKKDKSRHLFFWQHNMSFLSDWRLSVDYTKVSDKRYFSDFDSIYGNSTDGYATQQFRLGYFQPNYNISISGKKFQTFDDANIGPYRVLPKVDFNYYNDDLIKSGQFALFSQIAHFENDSKLMPTAWRFHLEPSLNFPFANRYGSLNVETKLYATHYAQQKGDGENAEDVKSSVNRVLPQVKIDVKTTLETDKPVFEDYTQTLEPRIQYLYRPYENQGDIGSKRQSNLGLGYDSALLQQDYYSLFNDRRYSGLDRIASANQITLGGTTRFFNDKTGDEVFNLSAGQIYYLTPSKVDNNSENSTARRSSSWSVESNWKFRKNWNWHGSYQYDTRLNETSLANTSLQFKYKENNFVQLNYRYASKNYIDQNLSSNRYGQDIKQLGGVLGWEISDSLAFVASHYYDLALRKPVTSQLGVTYSSCCWNVTLYAARSLTATPEGKSDTIKDLYYETRFGVNFELLFGTNYSLGVPKMLKRGIIPYTEAFSIY